MVNGTLEIIIFILLALVSAFLLFAYLARATRRQNTTVAEEEAKALAYEHSKINSHDNPYIGPSYNGLRPPSRAWLAYEKTCK